MVLKKFGLTVHPRSIKHPWPRGEKRGDRF